MRAPAARAALALLVLLAPVAGACSADSAEPGSGGTLGAPSGSGTTPGTVLRSGGGVVPLRVEVLARYPHDTGSYTQGLQFAPDGTLFESGGRYGESTLRLVDPTTGEVRRVEDLPEEVFAEGLALVDDQLIQLTWKEGRAFVWDAATFEPRGEHAYDGEGWGLCDDGGRLVMSDGSSTLTFRDRTTFEPLGTVTVVAAGQPVARLNELECVDGTVWANVYQTDRILQIDPTTGEVLAEALASGLLAAEEAADADVLNGIAWIPGTDTFLITGKEWPWAFEVRLVPA